MAETVRKKTVGKKATKKQMLDAVDAINGPVMKIGHGLRSRLRQTAHHRSVHLHRSQSQLITQRCSA